MPKHWLDGVIALVDAVDADGDEPVSPRPVTGWLRRPYSADETDVAGEERFSETAKNRASTPVHSVYTVTHGDIDLGLLFEQQLVCSRKRRQTNQSLFYRESNDSLVDTVVELINGRYHKAQKDGKPAKLSADKHLMAVTKEGAIDGRTDRSVIQQV